MGWSARIASHAPIIDFTNATSIAFELLDPQKFPAVTYAMESLRAGGGDACAALNAANEVAVSAFLEEKIKFGDIMRCVHALSETYFDKNTNSERITIEEIEDFDNMIRRRAAEYLEHGSFPQERKRHSP